jgi:hypothetical protein
MKSILRKARICSVYGSFVRSQKTVGLLTASAGYGQRSAFDSRTFAKIMHCSSFHFSKLKDLISFCCSKNGT